MKSMIRTALTVLLAVSVVGAIASASASAATCTKKAGSKKYSLCIAGEKTSTGLLTLQLKTGTSLKLKSKGAETEVICTEASGTSTAKTLEVVKNLALAEIHLKPAKCRVEGYSGCLVRTFEFGSPNEVYGAFGPAVENISMAVNGGSLWGRVWLTGSECPAGGGGAETPFRATGSGACTAAGLESEASEHTLACKLNATAFEAPATVEFELVAQLSGPEKGKKFSVIES